ncbi:hypothetical protein C8Q76DRAFT_808925 [Earliella scabrosa]|nr:hypothetical protein C8Q76DRAFT_808925 [Earliella scabrosa]
MLLWMRHRKLDGPTKSIRIVLPVTELKDPGAPASSQTLGRYPSSRSTDSVQPSRHILDYQIASAQILSSLTALAASASAVEDDSYNVDPSSSRGAPKTREQLSVIDERSSSNSRPRHAGSRRVPQHALSTPPTDLVPWPGKRTSVRRLSPTFPFVILNSTYSRPTPQEYKPTVQSITVAILEYHNVGKSSLLNSQALKGCVRTFTSRKQMESDDLASRSSLDSKPTASPTASPTAIPSSTTNARRVVQTSTRTSRTVYSPSIGHIVCLGEKRLAGGDVHGLIWRDLHARVERWSATRCMVQGMIRYTLQLFPGYARAPNGDIRKTLPPEFRIITP